MTDNDRAELRTWTPDPSTSYPPSQFPIELEAAHNAIEGIREDFAARAARRAADETVPDTLYQYTDIGGLYGICSHGEVWLSDAGYLNDPLEGTWVHHRAFEAAKRFLLRDDRFVSTCLSQVEAMLTPLPDPSLICAENTSEARQFAALEVAFSRAYVASFTTAGDLLSQWRGYGAGGAGVSIGFDLRDLDKIEFQTLFGDLIRPQLIKVEYNQDVQDEELEWLFKKMQTTFDDHYPRIAINNAALERFRSFFYYALRDSISKVRWEFKSPHYAEEQEWRLVAAHVSLQPQRFRMSNGQIVPYLAMSLPQKGRGWAIEEIILGPRCNDNVAHGLRSLLRQVTNPKVRRSNLSYR